MNVLLADDDIDTRYFFENALKEISISTSLTMVGDGEKLMNYLNENSDLLPQVIFLDLSMPRKTGFECLSEIKENPLFQNIPVVLFSTSYSRDISYEQGMITTLFEIGANYYIRKPGNIAQLKLDIHNVLLMVIENPLSTKKTN